MKYFVRYDRIKMYEKKTGVDTIMIHKIKHRLIQTAALILSVVFLFETASIVQATSIQDVEDQIKGDKNTLNEINGQISDLEDEQDLIEEEISDLDSELINTMTAIGLLEDDIAAKEEEIATAELEYEAAKKQEEEQYAAMKVQIQYMYENGNESYMVMLLEAGSFSELLNKAEYVNSIYEYSWNLFEEYQASRILVEEFQTKLATEKAELESDKAEMEEQSVYLDQLLEQKKAASANFDAQIARAKQEAAVYKAKIKQEEEQLKALKEEERKKQAAANTSNITVTKFDVSIIDKAPGTDLGKKIAKYACQFIGNPYVSGGTSLTNGADCSGFTYRVYKDFGYDIPRTSTQQRSAGKEVASLDQAQPGDLICYSGHVALYVGGGYVVHASSVKTGIKVSRADYKPILAIRRII